MGVVLLVLEGEAHHIKILQGGTSLQTLTIGVDHPLTVNIFLVVQEVVDNMETQ
jgi:hypothetical protein